MSSLKMSQKLESIRGIVNPASAIVFLDLDCNSKLTHSDQPTDALGEYRKHISTAGYSPRSISNLEIDSGEMKYSGVSSKPLL